MKSLVYFLPLVLCPLAAQTHDARSACMAALDAVRSAQSENLGPVITAVMDATGGDEQVFWKLMQEAADAGHPVALTWVAGQGLRQLAAQGVELQSSPEALQYRSAVERAAAAGYAPALVEMAHLLGSGTGAAPDEKKGMDYLMEACKMNHSRARAAYLLLSGRLQKAGADDAAVAAELKKKNFYVEEFLSACTTPGDEEKSREWLVSAASHGSPYAAGLLARYYMMQGKDSLAYDYLQMAVEREHPDSLAVMASMLLPGAELSPGMQELIKADGEAAIRLFRRAVLLGYTPALIPLAGEYNKQPEKYTRERVFELYRRAADMGDARGGVAYAYCLAAGRGCPEDAERGVRILNQLVDAGVAYAHMALAELYFNGTGVPADMSRALMELTSAASAGVPGCYTLMAVLAQLGNTARASDPARARLYLCMAEERGEYAPQQNFDALVQSGGWKFIP